MKSRIMYLLQLTKFFDTTISYLFRDSIFPSHLFLKCAGNYNM